MTLSAEDFTAIGVLLAGPDWKLPVSKMLGINERTVRRWASGEAAVPSGVVPQLEELCRSHATDLLMSAHRLKAIKVK
jgi:hypothetical protein